MQRQSCAFCQRRKIACNRQMPCNHCSRRKIDCVYARDEKRRPVTRAYTEALEGQVAYLEKFISSLVVADTVKRDEMLSTFRNDHLYQQASSARNLDDVSAIDRLTTPGEGQRFDAALATPGHFFGPTSIAVLASNRATPDLPARPSFVSQDLAQSSAHHGLDDRALSHVGLESTVADPGFLPSIFSPANQCCRDLMVLFFDKVYTQHMCLYREYFLRDYDAGGGPYYSHLLMYALCAMGGLVGTDQQRELSDLFARQCETVLFGQELEYTRFTTLQALLLMGTRAIGKGMNSKGWLFTGMAFRMIHEMGLHQDPARWKIPTTSELEREIFRRVYWAAFVIDKQMSVFFGRPPALQTREADVRDTIRIAYPPEWRGLLQKYISWDTTETTYEDGLALMAAFVQKVELCKIIHKMMTEVFARRDPCVSPVRIETSIQEIHASLSKWRDKLPSNVHWNPHTKSKVAYYTLHLHMLYHTTIMILHRPVGPLRGLDVTPAHAESLNICHDSLDMTLRLLKAHGKEFQYLPVTFVHTAATAASIILIERDIQGFGYDRPDSDRYLQLLVDALRSVGAIWTCAVPILDAIVSSLSGASANEAVTDSPEYDLLAHGLDYDQSVEYHNAEPFNYENVNIDPSFLLATTTLEDEFLNLDSV